MRPVMRTSCRGREVAVRSDQLVDTLACDPEHLRDLGNSDELGRTLAPILGAVRARMCDWPVPDLTRYRDECTPLASLARQVGPWNCLPPAIRPRRLQVPGPPYCRQVVLASRSVSKPSPPSSPARRCMSTRNTAITNRPAARTGRRPNQSSKTSSDRHRSRYVGPHRLTHRPKLPSVRDRSSWSAPKVAGVGSGILGKVSPQNLLSATYAWMCR